jgi:IS5 family transposase
MEEALHDTSLYCEFSRRDPSAMRLPDETTILRFRHLNRPGNELTPRIWTNFKGFHGKVQN